MSKDKVGALRDHVDRTCRRANQLLDILRRVAKTEFRVKQIRNLGAPDPMVRIAECSLREAEGKLAVFLAHYPKLAESAALLRLFCLKAEAERASLEELYGKNAAGKAIEHLASALEETRLQLVRDGKTRRLVRMLIKNGRAVEAEKVLCGVFPNYELLRFLVGEIKDGVLDLLKELTHASRERGEQEKQKKRKRPKKKR
ncbi:MAG: hypothetical protein UY56_C0005G0021 [Parcubacteria group bacterium GW2011_GWA1_50_14]|uniref:Uncharacterized protein n=1 Tax=Candidatus Liptonbacteria bacterium GWB1_49_6 TaxID=1798644 RepID=A0A1G2C5B1_9BACT|nr:MAG: hypothetical protein UY56_C0005G0021 [Parcubacteria group bacterium GW2011_GWA1_50_14]OGY96311.1 MAG: hypothetical protein A2122_00725 [Candidatus Liptonbacteria bacterium GWB1_49_6]